VARLEIRQGRRELRRKVANIARSLHCPAEMGVRRSGLTRQSNSGSLPGSMRLWSLFTALVFLAVANTPCFSGGLPWFRGDAQHEHCDSGAPHHQVVEAKAEAGQPSAMHGSMASTHESGVQPQGEAIVTARCDCGCSDAPPAAGSWERLGAALARPPLEPVHVAPANVGEARVAHITPEPDRSIYHVPIPS
jgi:hypothetical protein